MSKCPCCHQELHFDTSNAVLLDNMSYTVYFNKHNVKLSPTEYKVFKLIYMYWPEYVTIERIVLHIYPEADGGPLGAENIVRIMKHRINEKLGGIGLSLTNIWGMGYKLKYEDKPQKSVGPVIDYTYAQGGRILKRAISQT